MSFENRIDQRFALLRETGKRAFISYVCAGDPEIDRCLDILRALDRTGVDVIEMGLPFSDPMADGVVNQMAAHRALEAGVTVPKVLDLVRRFRLQSETPIVLFTYLNPIYAYGFSAFHADAAAAGVDGLLLLDLPPEEAKRNCELMTESGLCQIRLIAPTTPEERMKKLVTTAEGFVYYVSREGVTGTQTSLADGISENVAAIKRYTSVPVAVGFGISTPEQAATVARTSDGVIVGSAIVRIVAEHATQGDAASAVEAFVKPLVEAVKSV